VEKAGGNGTTEIFTNVENSGRIVGTSGVRVLGGAVTNNAIIEADAASAVVSANPTGGGVLAIADGGTLRRVATGVCQTAEFLDSTGMLALDDPGGFRATIENFDGGNTIDVNPVVNSTSYVGGVLNLLNNGGNVAVLDLMGNCDGLAFNIAPPRASRSFVSITAPCVPRAPVSLPKWRKPGWRICALASTCACAFGGMAPAVRLGHRHVDCRKHPRPQDVWPIHVRAGTFGAGLPHRDLLLSPDHAVYVDAVLIAIRTLVNGAASFRNIGTASRIFMSSCPRTM